MRCIIFVVNDKLGTPTYTIDFAKNTELLIRKEAWGLYNLVCRGVTSRLEVAKKILYYLNLEKNIKLTEVNSDYFKKDYFSFRPNSERLINKKLNEKSLDIMRDWEICLKEYLEEYYSNYV